MPAAADQSSAAALITKDDDTCVNAAEAYLNCVLKTALADQEEHCLAPLRALRTCCAERDIVAIRLRSDGEDQEDARTEQGATATAATAAAAATAATAAEADPAAKDRRREPHKE